MSGRTGSVAHVAESTDGDTDALIVFVDGDNGERVWIAGRDGHERESTRASQVFRAALEHVNTAA